MNDLAQHNLQCDRAYHHILHSINEFFVVCVRVCMCVGGSDAQKHFMNVQPISISDSIISRTFTEIATKLVVLFKLTKKQIQREEAYDENHYNEMSDFRVIPLCLCSESLICDNF